MKTKNLCTILSCLLLVFQQTTTKYNPLIRKETKDAKPLLRHPHPSKFVKNMNEQELCDMLPYAKEKNDTELVYKVFHLLMTVSTDLDALKKYKLDLADYSYQLKNYEKASMAYEEFFMLYPGADEVEYSQYKAILCWFYMSLAPENDQQFTHKTIMLIDDFVRKFTNPKYLDEVKDIKKQCRQKLFEHEAHILSTYLKQSKFKSAQRRLDYIKSNFKELENINSYVSYLEKMYSLAEGPNRPFMININLQDALAKKEEKKSGERKKKTALFFLS